MPELQGQRGLAALAIVLFHVYQYDRSGPDGHYPLEDSWIHPVVVGLDGAVDWFFVLSAFLLTLPYARALHDGRPLPSVREFLGRRAVRILPLYVVAVVLVWASRNPELPGEWRDLLEHLTFTQVFDSQRIFFTIGPAWSLAVEVHFYLLVAALSALLARTTARAGTPLRRLSGLCAGIALAAAVSVAWFVGHGLAAGREAVEYAVWFGLPSKLVVFACGMAAAVVVTVRPGQLGRATTRALRAAGTAGFLVTAVAVTDREQGSAEWSFHALCGLAFTALVLAGALGPASGAWHRWSSRGLLPWVGLVSYSLYLWHEPLLLELAAHGLLPAPGPTAFAPSVAIVTGLSLLAAAVSYWLVEYPASHLRVFLTAVPSRRLTVPEQR
jgi:peptidoglycan/LPS O-acetylase OafA/YrhL